MHHEEVLRLPKTKSRTLPWDHSVTEIGSSSTITCHLGWPRAGQKTEPAECVGPRQGLRADVTNLRA